MTSSTEAHGLAGKICACKASETFDLAGLNSSTIASTIKNAFSSPFRDLPSDVEMIRITLVTGAGKLGRARYDENAAKIVGQELRALGYEQDSSASCVAACAGSYKSQHDTGKNLKTIVVFPKIEQPLPGIGGGATPRLDATNGEMSSNILSKQEEMIVSCPTDLFEKLVKTNCQSWSEKKICSNLVSRLQEIISEMEQRLVQGHPLTDAEQSIYDAVPTDSLKEKHAIVRNLLQGQVESGNIARLEKAQLISQSKERLQSLQDELEMAEVEGKTKKVEKLRANKIKLETRLDMLEKMTPKPQRPLKYQAEIGMLREELAPLLKLESTAKGRLLSVKETQQLARKEVILQEIHQLEQDSRGLFESDEAFDDRVQQSNALPTSRQGGKGKEGTKKAPLSSAKTPNFSTAKPSSANPWVTASSLSSKPILRRPVASSTGQSHSKKTKQQLGGGGGLFAAMMLDNDSDSD